MIKLLMIGILLYFAYRIFLPPGLPPNDDQQKIDSDEEYTDYEEVE